MGDGATLDGVVAGKESSDRQSKGITEIW